MYSVYKVTERTILVGVTDTWEQAVMLIEEVAVPPIQVYDPYLGHGKVVCAFEDDEKTTFFVYKEPESVHWKKYYGGYGYDQYYDRYDSDGYDRYDRYDSDEDYYINRMGVDKYLDYLVKVHTPVIISYSVGSVSDNNPWYLGVLRKYDDSTF